MNSAKPGGHVGVEAGNKRNARRSPQPRGANSRDRHAQEKREGRNDPASPNTAGHVADSLHEALQYADVALAYGNEQRQCRPNVEQTGKKTAPGDGTGKSLLRTFNFITHNRSELQTDEAETDHAEGIQYETRVRRNAEIGRRYGRAEPQPDHNSQADQDSRGNKSADRAEIVHPLSDAETNDVQHHE